MLRQELTTIRDLIVQVQKGAIDAGRARSELNQMTMRQNNWTMGTYCQSYCRVVTAHHGLEDSAVFPHLGPEEVPLATTSSVGEWDSLATLNLIAVIQEEFGVEIEPEDFENFVSFELVLDLLERKVHAP